MTVKELILALAELPPEHRVSVRDSDMGDVDVAEVYLIDSEDAYAINNINSPGFVRIRTKQ